MDIISDKLSKILSAVFGKDVRQALHDGLDAINKETESTTSRQYYLDRKYDEQIKNMTLQDPSSAEIVDMRVAANGKTFEKAGDRLNYFDEQLDTNIRKEYIKNSFKKSIKNDNLYGFKSINVLGTSISHGANAFDIVNQSWAGIMRKFIQEEFNTNNHGYVSMIDISNTVGKYVDYHIINPIGSWSKNLTSDTIGFGSYSSTTLGDKLEFTIKKPFKYFKVLFRRQTNGGLITAKIETTVADINTSGSNFGAGISNKLEVYGEPDFPCTLTLEKKDNSPTEILGIIYYNNEDDVFFNNYSRSGLTLAEIDNNILDYICNTNILFFELGHNDKYSSTNIEAFKEKINRIISKVNEKEVTVVVLDTIWYEDINDSYRTEIKRLADNTNSIYIPFHEIINYDDNITWQNKDFLSDFSHPSPNGHKQIAEITAKECKLGITSKNVVEKLQNKSEWSYLELKNNWVEPNPSLGNSFKNKVIKDGNIITLQIYAKDGEPGSVAFTLPSEYRPKLTWNNVVEFNGTQYKSVRIDGYSGDVTLEYTTSSKIFSTIITFRTD